MDLLTKDTLQHMLMYLKFHGLTVEGKTPKFPKPFTLIIIDLNVHHHHHHPQIHHHGVLHLIVMELVWKIPIIIDSVLSFVQISGLNSFAKNYVF